MWVAHTARNDLRHIVWYSHTIGYVTTQEFSHKSFKERLPMLEFKFKFKVSWLEVSFKRPWVERIVGYKLAT